jgi:hypothetical protein
VSVIAVSFHVEGSLFGIFSNTPSQAIAILVSFEIFILVLIKFCPICAVSNFLLWHCVALFHPFKLGKERKVLYS